MDPYVIDIAWPLRWFFVHALILPKRPKLSGAAYEKIWTDRGSPLRFHLEDLTEKTVKLLGDGWNVKPAMRYGEPSIKNALREFVDEGVTEVKVVPLYPQYSLAATESSIAESERLRKKFARGLKLRFQSAFYSDPGFIEAFASVAKTALQDFSHDFVLFSFHGLPERQVKKTDKTGAHCLSKSDCCAAIAESNRDCYRAQCFTTAKLLARALHLKPGSYDVSFQSRLGRTPWIKPYTDKLYEELPKRGIKRLAVICPAFVSDCLETLEEIAIRGREDFIRKGGEELRLVPSLNASDVWAHALAKMVVK